MIQRYFISFNMAALITFGLFFAMQLLISNGDIVLTEKTIRPGGIIIAPRTPEPPKKRERLPDEPEQIIAPPEVIIPFTGDKTSKVGPIPEDGGTKFAPPKINPVSSSAFTDEGGLMVIIRPAPQYPEALAEKGIEGYVRFRYTVTEFGATTNIEIIESTHRGFERNALKAVEKFKFKPHVEDGVAKPVDNVYSTIEFKLQN